MLKKRMAIRGNPGMTNIDAAYTLYAATCTTCS